VNDSLYFSAIMALEFLSSGWGVTCYVFKNNLVRGVVLRVTCRKDTVV